MSQLRRFVLIIGAAVAVVAGLAFGAWSLISERMDSGQPAMSSAEPEGPGVIHVHGLGINSGNGALYAATHSGLFAIPSQGRAQRVAGRFQDTMAFTIAGSDSFLASGHPDIRDYLRGAVPPLLGLIESRNAGQTWQPLSLLGQADFHTLRIVDGRIYGYDSTGGVLLTSADRRQWETLARLVIEDFVINPKNPNQFIASTPAGLQTSMDGGRTWQPHTGPPLKMLGWDPEAGLWGLTAQGGVFHATDDGATWQQTGTAGGVPEAMLVTPDALYVAIQEQGIRVSADGGMTWTERYREETP